MHTKVNLLAVPFPLPVSALMSSVLKIGKGPQNSKISLVRRSLSAGPVTNTTYGSVITGSLPGWEAACRIENKMFSQGQKTQTNKQTNKKQLTTTEKQKYKKSHIQMRNVS